MSTTITIPKKRNRFGDEIFNPDFLILEPGVYRDLLTGKRFKC